MKGRKSNPKKLMVRKFPGHILWDILDSRNRWPSLTFFPHLSNLPLSPLLAVDLSFHPIHPPLIFPWPVLIQSLPAPVWPEVRLGIESRQIYYFHQILPNATRNINISFTYALLYSHTLSVSDLVTQHLPIPYLCNTIYLLSVSISWLNIIHFLNLSLTYPHPNICLVMKRPVNKLCHVTAKNVYMGGIFEGGGSKWVKPDIYENIMSSDGYAVKQVGR